MYALVSTKKYTSSSIIFNGNINTNIIFTETITTTILHRPPKYNQKFGIGTTAIETKKLSIYKKVQSGNKPSSKSGLILDKKFMQV